MSNPVKDIPHYLRIFQIYLGKRIYVAFFFTFLAAAAEGVGILMMLPLLQSLDGVGGQLDPQLASSTQTAAPSGFSDLLLNTFGLDGSAAELVVLITLAFMIKGGFVFAAAAVNSFLKAELLGAMKLRLFQLYSQMTLAYYSEKNTGYFINVVNSQAGRAVESFFSFAQMGSQLVNTVIYLCLAFVVAWRFGLMALTAGMALLIVFIPMNAYVKRLSRKSGFESGRLASLLIQTLQAFKYLISTEQMQQLAGKIESSVASLTRIESKVGLVSAFTHAAREPVAVILIMAIVLVQIIYLDQPLAPILVSIVLFYRGINSTLATQMGWQQTLRNIGGLEHVHQEFSSLKLHQEVCGDTNIEGSASDIALVDVSFSYENTHSPALHNITLNIPAKKFVALVGHSGAGKSTLVDLITLMHKPTAGKILISGIPADAIAQKSWRSRIGYVSQETVIFNDTILNNICLQVGSGVEADVMADVKHAARMAYIADYIESLPDAYATIVGDRGIRLSGGQRQRLFIARELYRKPSLLILDEATSALDSESEREVQRSIEELKGKITVIVIAHRLSTIRNVDTIYVFDKGRLVEQGSFDSLMADQESRFSKLALRQAL